MKDLLYLALFAAADLILFLTLLTPPRQWSRWSVERRFTLILSGLATGFTLGMVLAG